MTRFSIKLQTNDSGGYSLTIDAEGFPATDQLPLRITSEVTQAVLAKHPDFGEVSMEDFPVSEISVGHDTR